MVDGAAVHDPDDLNKVKRVIQAAKEDTEIFPHLNNYNPNTQRWDPAIALVLNDASKRAALCQQIVRFLTYDQVRDLLETLRGHSKVETLIAPAKDAGKEPASAPPGAVTPPPPTPSAGVPLQPGAKS